MSGVSGRLAAPAFSQALPAYLGGKRRLSHLIFAELATVLPQQNWPHTTLLDPFCGGGAIALYAKGAGFRVIASDLAERGAVVARALIANSSVRLRFEDILDLFREPLAEHAGVAARYCPQVFSAAQAEFLDRAFGRAMARPEPLRSLLLLTLMKVTLRLQPMSMLRGTDARAAATGDYDGVSPRRLRHYMTASRLLMPDGVWSVAKEVNHGVFGGRGEAQKGDALEIIGAAQVDLVYLDPPYPGTTSYTGTYGPLDDLLGDRSLPSKAPAIEDLLDVTRHIPVVVLSYGGPRMSLPQLVTMVAKQRRVHSALAVPYPHLRSISREEKNATNEEYLVVAGR